MSRSRHKNRASGGKVTAYAGGDSNVMKEAHERKRGGRVHEVEGERGPSGAHLRKRGGAAHHAKKEHHGVHHAGRKRGGGVGANLTPLSTAARIKRLPGEEAEDSHKD